MSINKKTKLVRLIKHGNFYESYDEDAEIISGVLGITLTTTKNGAPLAGIPYHILESSVTKLLKSGFDVEVDGL